MLWASEQEQANVVFRGARVLDPAEGIDARLDVRIDDGVITAVAETVDTNEHRVVDATGLVLAPAFVDPHVHLRTPGREDEETIASGTAAAAAGGYCAILAMPNTDPVVDSAAVLGSLLEQAREHAEIPVGFLAAITPSSMRTSSRASIPSAGSSTRAPRRTMFAACWSLAQSITRPPAARRPRSGPGRS